MYKNATVAQWYKTHGKHEIYAAGKEVSLGNYEHSLVIDAADAARVKSHHDDDGVAVTAAEENKARRRAAQKEEAKVRAIYEELVLKKSQPAVVTIGSVQQIKNATPANHTAPVVISNANGNGNGHTNGNGNGLSNDNGEKKPEVAETVAGD